MLRLAQFSAVGILVSFYLFPIGFSFFPAALNTKMILAVVGAGLFGYQCIKERQINLSNGMLGTLMIAVLFSLMSFFSAETNNTVDYSYATYFTSLGVWLAGAYTVAWAIRSVHGSVTFKRLTFYLAGVCFAQCVVAIMIDNSTPFQLLVDSYVLQGQEFFQEVDRLYGIGAALDTAGVRFSVVLVLIVALLCKDEEVRRSRTQIIFLLIAFFTVAFIGNIISRTTIIGVGAAAIFFMMASGLFQPIVRFDSLKLGVWFGGMLLVFVAIATFLYQTDPVFHDHIRFAFEGFFNLVETGVWRTDSTDKLNREMWVWPDDLRTWMIGSGVFGNWAYSTDIGYCRFILYCGLIGFSIFASLFVFLAILFSSQNPSYRLMFIFLMLLSFVIWIKVATDIFQIYALFFCIDQFIKQPVNSEEVYENRLQHSSYP